MGAWDRVFTALATAKRATAEASAEIVTRLGLPRLTIIVTGVASDGVNEEQVVTIDADGGTFTLDWNGDTTAAIDFDATAAEVQTELEGLDGVTAGDVSVAGDAGGPWTVTFLVNFADTDVDPITIDDSLLTKAGSVVIATVTAGTHTAAEADTQSITVVATGGTWKLTYSGQQTAALDHDATAAQVQTALEALSNIAAASADVIVTGGPGDINGSWPYVITYVATGALAASDTGVTAQDVDLSNTGRVDITETVRGGPTANEKQTVALTGVTSGNFKITVLGEETAAIAYNASTTTMKTRLTDLDAFTTDDIAVTGSAGAWVIEFKGDYASLAMDMMTVSDNSTVAADGVTAGQLMVGIAAATAVNERQSVTVTGTGGTFTLTYSGQTTAAIDFDSSAADVQAALEALSNIAVGDVIVSGDAGGPFTVEFSGTLRYTNVAVMTASAASLTDDIGASSVVESVKGEVAGTALGYKVQLPDGEGGWTDMYEVVDALTDDGTDIFAFDPRGNADGTNGAPSAFRIESTQTGVWTYTITGQFSG